MGGRYQTFTYGSQKYGASGSPHILWAVEIDWDADGIFDGTNEARYVTNLTATRGRQYYINPNGDGFQPMTVGRIDITLDNSSRRFDPWFTHGPLYGKILPGRKARVWLRYQDQDYPVMAGYVSDPQPISGDYSRVKLTILDGVQYLVENPVSVLLRQNISYADAIGAILDAIDWPTVWGRSLETGIAELPYWWADGENSQTAIQFLVDAALGTFFVAADGKARFYSRNHISTSVLSTDQVDFGRQIIIQQPWEVVRNLVRIAVHPLTVQSPGDLWTMGDKPFINPGESLTVFANFSYLGAECPAINVVTPVATTDYLANTASDGSGTDLTASITIQMTVFSKTAKIVITNNSASLAYVTLLKVRGDAITEVDTTTVEAHDLASQAAFGKHEFALDTPWMRNINNAKAFADMIKVSMALPRSFPQVMLEGRPDIQFTPDLFDAVTVHLESMGINDDFRLGRIEHQWLESTGQSVRTIWKLETFENFNEDSWQFPTRIGISSKFAL